MNFVAAQIPCYTRLGKYFFRMLRQESLTEGLTLVRVVSNYRLG